MLHYVLHQGKSRTQLSCPVMPLHNALRHATELFSPYSQVYRPGFPLRERCSLSARWLKDKEAHCFLRVSQFCAVRRCCACAT